MLRGVCLDELYCHLFFFFQAEDGIRDLTVTGVQTCALPISRRELRGVSALARDPDHRHAQETAAHELIERRVDLAIAQIAGGPEQHHGITVTAFHGFPRRDLRTRGASPTGPCWRTRPARVTRSAHTVPRSAPGRARRFRPPPPRSSAPPPSPPRARRTRRAHRPAPGRPR